MGCRQSKPTTDSSLQQNSTFGWLAGLGLQQHYAAFYTAGYGNVKSLVGLTRNHLNVIGQGCTDGLPEEHKQVILAAAQQLGVDHSPTFSAQTAAASSHDQSASTSAHADETVRPDQQQQALPLKGTNRLASHALDTSISSCKSFTSDSGSDRTLTASRGSISQSDTAAMARQASRQAPSRFAAALDKPAPSQSQLQVLYSQMEADYKKLRDRPAHSRAVSHPPVHAAAMSHTSLSFASSQHHTSGVTAVTAPTRQGRGQSLTVASSPAAKRRPGPGSLQGPACVQVAAGVPVNAAGLQQAQASLVKVSRSNRHSHLIGGRVFSPAVGVDPGCLAGDEGALSGAGDKLEGAGQVRGMQAGGVQHVSAAAAVKQMRKQKSVLPAEPFVQVFTNFHTLSKDASLLEALPSVQQDQAMLIDAQAQPHHCDMQSELIAAQHLPDPYQQQFQHPSPTEARHFQFPSMPPKPHPVIPQSQVQVNQPFYSSELPRHDQPSDHHVDSQQQSYPDPVASSGMLNGRDQYEVLCLQSSLIPRQSHSSPTVPSQAQLSPLPYQVMPQPQFVQSVTHKSAFSASAISCQTPQAVSASQSASQQDSVTVQQSSGHALTSTRHQERQHSMHHQLNAGDVTQGNGAVDEQGQSIRAGQQQPCDRQQRAILNGEGEGPYDTQGQGFRSEQQQPYSVAAAHLQCLTEHTVSRSSDGSSVTESRIVASSSSHYEFSFRRDTSRAALPRPGMAGGAGSTAAEALRVIRAAKLYRHGSAAQSPVPAPALQTRRQPPDQSEMVRQQMMYMDAQIRQRVQQLQQHL